MSPEEYFRKGKLSMRVDDILNDMANEGLYTVDKESSDNVNSPKHYSLNHKGIECIDAMEAALTPEEFKGYLHGNIIKYIWRYKYKNGLEDLEKAQWYLNRLIGVTNE